MDKHELVRCHFSTNKTRMSHSGNHIEIIYVLEGAIELEAGQCKHTIETDDFMVINSNVGYSYHASEKVLVGRLMIPYASVAALFEGQQLYFYCNSSNEKSEKYDTMRYCIRQIFNYQQFKEGQSIILQRGLCYRLLYIMTSNFTVKKGMDKYNSLRGIKDERMNEILNYIMNHYKEQITLNDLSNQLYLSTAYISKYIKKNVGLSFLKLLNNIRLEYAVEELIHSDKTIIKIAMDHGFSNLAAFNREFQEMYQESPKEYRKKNVTERGGEIEETEKEVLAQVEQYMMSNLVDTAEAEHFLQEDMTFTVKDTKPLHKNWKEMINIGAAVELLRFDVREQVLYLVQNLGFRYVRFWNLLSSDMMIQENSDSKIYNFSEIDKVLDFLVKHHIYPYIELSTKKKVLFENVEKMIFDVDLYVEKEKNVTQLEGCFLDELMRHIVSRYGVEEVEHWYIELEKNTSSLWKRVPGEYDQTVEEYFRAFDMVYTVLKKYAPNINIGGPGGSIAYVGSKVMNIYKLWAQRKIHPDFITMYCYPYIMDQKLVAAGRNPYLPEENILSTAILNAKEMLAEVGFSHIPIHVSEWSSTLSNRNVLNDGAFKGAYMMKNYMQNHENAEMAGYWIGTDIFSGYYDSKELLFGGCGLVSKDGICKPVFYAFLFLNRLKKYIIGESENVLATYDGKQSYSICCHNYKHFNFRFYLEEENKIKIESQERLFEDNENKQIHIKIRDIENGIYVVKEYSVSKEVGNIQHEWKKIGYYESLNLDEISYLQAVSQPKVYISQQNVTGHELELNLLLKAQEMKNIMIERSIPSQDKN